MLLPMSRNLPELELPKVPLRPQSLSAVERNLALRLTFSVRGMSRYSGVNSSLGLRSVIGWKRPGPAVFEAQFLGDYFQVGLCPEQGAPRNEVGLGCFFDFRGAA